MSDAKFRQTTIEEVEVTDQPGPVTQFSRQAEGRSSGIVSELWGLLRHNKKWWLTPVILVLLVLGLLIVFGGGVAAPFIYTLF